MSRDPNGQKAPQMCRYSWDGRTRLRQTVLLDCFVVPPRNDVHSMSRFDSRNMNANEEIPFGNGGVCIVASGGQ
ncbi:MAG: hypothetical protein IJL04_05265 [Bacteroidales bacterium]|nr:hypothetical protein [Bacteroidales bacterium]